MLPRRFVETDRINVNCISRLTRKRDEHRINIIHQTSAANKSIIMHEFHWVRSQPSLVFTDIPFILFSFVRSTAYIASKYNQRPNSYSNAGVWRLKRLRLQLGLSSRSRDCSFFCLMRSCQQSPLATWDNWRGIHASGKYKLTFRSDEFTIYVIGHR